MADLEDGHHIVCDKQPQTFVCITYSLVFSKTQLAAVEFFTGIV